MAATTYDSFAGVYDALMDDVPYEQWGKFIYDYLSAQNIPQGLMLELGCGTGKMMEIMASYGYDMIGVDSSPEMLEIAREKPGHTPDRFLYLLQDMRSFELYGTVASVISICDSINYITDPADLVKVFSLVNNYLDPGGIFLFDFNTEHKYRDCIGNTVIAEDRDDISFIWYNEYDRQEHLNYIDLNVFVREEDGRYRKFTEEHIQRGYTLGQIKDMLEKSGLQFLAAFDGYSEDEADKDSERILVAAREYGKRIDPGLA